MKIMRIITLILFFCLIWINGSSQQKAKSFISQSKDGKLEYEVDENGNRVPDFSYCGYMSGAISIPEVKIKAVVSPVSGDATLAIQQAIDYVSSLTPDKDGFRGTVLLKSGNYSVSKNITIHTSGVVLRGSGMGNDGTNLIAAGKDRRTLVRIEGKDNRLFSKDTLIISDQYVPVNSMSVTVSGRNNLKTGDKIVICRPSTKEWIETLKTFHFGGGINSLGWKPGEHNIYWDRTVTEVNGNKVTFDAPITTALEQKYSGGFIIQYSWEGRINQTGIENLNCISEYDEENKKDEAHSWMAVTLANVTDAWVRNVTFKHFAGSAVFIQETGSRITVENCKSLEPISEIGGQRRYAFFTMGQQCLFQRLYSEYAYHDFGLGFCAPGPNAFVQCYAYLPYSFSGPVDSWASGVLFDIVNIDGNALSYFNRGQDAQGAGWNAANSVFWQCSPSRMDCFAPPTAMNWAFGSWSEFSGDGYWNNSNNHIQPRSLFYAQLEERLGANYEDRSFLIPINTSATSSPTIDMARTLTDAAVEPAITLFDWIDKIITDHPLSVDATGAKVLPVEKMIVREALLTDPASFLSVRNGWLARTVKNGNRITSIQIQTGLKHNVTWWNGTVQPAYIKKTASPHLTRFVPGRTGTGLTDDISEVVSWMKNNNVLAIDHNYGLWYDRRRDDHERIRRMTGEVWPPFYEQPFARSGEGLAFDGLSKYDLTKYNEWYWMRLKQFADLADENGLVLLHQNYFQHNIIEAGAHWTDSPWRTANNINNTGFPEPVPYAGDKRVFMAEQFYDITDPVRRELHRAYIRQCLNNFRNNHSVIQLISEEFTGPLHFVEFWLDVIAEWKNETGAQPLIALSTTKDVQDAILADPVRSSVVDIIDIRYWFYREDGSTYEPKGGQNLAPRQHARLTKPGKVSFESVYRAVSEYKTKFPDKAVTYYSTSYPQFAWASFIAGGSLACLPEIENEKFLTEASSMQLIKEWTNNNQYVLGNKEHGYIVYSVNGTIELDLRNVPGKFNAYWVNPGNGKVQKAQSVKGGQLLSLQQDPLKHGNILWLTKN